MNENAKKKIENSTQEIEYKLKFVYQPSEQIAADLSSAINLLRDRYLLQGIKFGLEKALEIIDEEERKDEQF